jgi:hypothetical protein
VLLVLVLMARIEKQDEEDEDDVRARAAATTRPCLAQQRRCIRVFVGVLRCAQICVVCSDEEDERE